MKSKIFTALFVGIAAVVGYNYFFGNETEKAQAHTVTKEVKESVVALKDFMVTQKDKADINAIKGNLARAGDLLKRVGNEAANFDAKFKTRAEDLDAKRAKLEQTINHIDNTARDAKQQKLAAETELAALVHDIDALTKDMDK
jgi:chromosome segregation ATPase